ncbi:hypothetical protein Glove_227g79 [Diversispora epigaea]|uniref:HMG box domain-containing protein n=1 Tax=Diversispora epigaea TaxID=1348612 RepID=A0A397IMW2_9GLOM|nr:hypothetical protein Glove_227g79 [Diversispora epigaea]
MEEKNKRRFKPVLKTTTISIPFDTSSSSIIPEQPLIKLQSMPKTVNASTQKRQKIQKVLDGQVKKITSPRKKKIPSDNTIPIIESEESNPSAVSTLRADSNIAVTQPASLVNSLPLGSNADNGRSSTSVAQESTIAASFPPAAKNSKKRKNKAALTDNVNNDGEVESKSRRTRKPKDPNAPKKPANSYLFFSMIKRNEIKDKNPNVDAKKIVALIGEAWRNLSEDEKKPYKEMVETAKKKYEEDLKVYNASINKNPIVDNTNNNKNKNQASISHDQKELSQSLVPLVPMQNLIEPRITLCNQQNDLLQVSSSQFLSPVGGVSLVGYTTYGQQQQQQEQETLLEMPDNGNKLDFQYQNMEIFDDYFIQYLNPNIPNIHISTTILPSFEKNIREYSDNQNISRNFSITQDEQQTQNVRQDLLHCQPYEPPTIIQHGPCESSDRNTSLYLFPPGERTQGSIELNRETIFSNAMPHYDSNSFSASMTHQTSSENSFLCQSFEPPLENKTEKNHESIQNANNNNSPVIIHSQERDSVNLLFQAFEPPPPNINNNVKAKNSSNSWYQNSNRIQYLMASPSSVHQYVRNTAIFQGYQEMSNAHHQNQVTQEMNTHRQTTHEIIDSNITKSNFSQYMHQHQQDASQGEELLSSQQVNQVNRVNQHQIHQMHQMIPKEITEYGTQQQHVNKSSSSSTMSNPQMIDNFTLHYPNDSSLNWSNEIKVPNMTRATDTDDCNI